MCVYAIRLKMATGTDEESGCCCVPLLTKRAPRVKTTEGEETYWPFGVWLGAKDQTSRGENKSEGFPPAILKFGGNNNWKKGRKRRGTVRNEGKGKICWIFEKLFPKKGPTRSSIKFCPGPLYFPPLSRFSKTVSLAVTAGREIKFVALFWW